MCRMIGAAAFFLRDQMGLDVTLLRTIVFPLLYSPSCSIK